MIYCDQPEGRVTTLPMRFDLQCHSPDGPEWGYHGSGPAQLALALMADATGDDRLAMRVYRDFKDQIVADLADNWRMTAGEIAKFAAMLEPIR